MKKVLFLFTAIALLTVGLVASLSACGNGATTTLGGAASSTPGEPAATTAGEPAETAQHVHSGEWQTVKEASCTEEGLEERTCAECKEKETRVIPKSAHTMQNDVCTVCGAKATEGLKIKVTIINQKTKYATVVGIDSAVNRKEIEEIILPSVYKYLDKNVYYDVPITEISKYAFEYCSNLKSITIPDSITTIDMYAFYGCSRLTSIIFPESVTTIGESAFEGCSNLQVSSLPERVTSISKNAFYGCLSLTNITIPESVTTIGNGAFRKCSSLTSVSLPKRVTSIGLYAFEGCSNLTSINIPESVTIIDWGAFEGCSNLESITIPESVTTIGEWAFSHCDALVKVEFENPTGWRDAYNQAVDLSDPVEAAEILKSGIALKKG